MFNKKQYLDINFSIKREPYQLLNNFVFKSDISVPVRTFSNHRKLMSFGIKVKNQFIFFWYSKDNKRVMITLFYYALVQ